jgi:dihydrolipoamide dehydrogenase
MAAYFHNLTKDVRVIEFQDHIAGPTDLEISTELYNYYEKRNIHFNLSSAVTKVTKDSVTVKNNKTGKEEIFKYEKLLLATGRRANIKGYGLENIQVYTENGAIVTDNKGRTNIPNVYAIGDVNGKSMLAHTAYREAEVVCSQLTGDD